MRSETLLGALRPDQREAGYSLREEGGFLNVVYTGPRVVATFIAVRATIKELQEAVDHIRGII